MDIDKLSELLSNLDISDDEINELCNEFDSLKIYEDRIEIIKEEKRIIIYRRGYCGIETNKHEYPKWIY